MATALVAATTLLTQLPFFDMWFNFMDEGHMVQFADMVLRGGEFYRDATFYPLPGAFYFLVLVFKLFGSSILISRWVVMIQFTLFVTLVFVFLRRTASLGWALGGVVCMLLYRIWCFPHWQIYSYSTSSLLVLFVSLLLLLRFFESGDRRSLGLAGFSFGLGVLCKQDYGTAAFVTVIAALLVHGHSGPRAERTRLLSLFAWFFLPAALVGALTGLHYWRVGILDELLRFTVFNHFTGMSTYEYMEFPDLFPIFGQDPALRTRFGLMGYMPGIVFTTDWAVVRGHPLFTDTPLYDMLLKLFFFGPQLYLAGCAVRLGLLRRDLAPDAGPERRTLYLRELVIVIFAASLVSLVWLNKPQDYLHLAVLYWPLICLGVIHARALLHGRRRAAVICLGVIVLPAALIFGYSGRMLWKFYDSNTDLIPGKRAGIYAKPSEVAMLREVVSYMQENSEPHERVAAMPYFPIVNFLAERDGPHRSAYIIWPFPELPERDQRVIEAMEETGTNLVIWNFTQFFSFDPVWQHAPILFEYLVDNFEIDRVFTHDAWGYKLVGLRRTAPGAEEVGERLIPEGARGIEISVLGDGPPRPVPPDARAAYVEERSWPFRRALALRASTGGRRTVMSVPLRVPASGGRIRSAVAVHPQWWFKLPPSWVSFTLSVKSEAGREEVFAKRLNPTVVLADRAWFELDVPLDRYKGQQITLEFANEAERPRGETLWMGGWAVPRLVPGAGEARGG